MASSLKKLFIDWLLLEINFRIDWFWGELFLSWLLVGEWFGFGKRFDILLSLLFYREVFDIENEELHEGFWETTDSEKYWGFTFKVSFY